MIKFYRISLLILTLFLLAQKGYSQRNNNIVLRDTIFSEGYIKQEPEDKKNTVYFKWKRKDPWTKYSIEEVEQFYVTSTTYLRRKLPMEKGGELVFLELIPSQKEGYKLLRSIENKKDLYLETQEGLQVLNYDFKDVLFKVDSNPSLKQLLEITNLKAYDIAYFLTQSGTFKAPRTYTKPTSFSVFAGTAMTVNKFNLPFSNELATVRGVGMQAGFSWEMLPTQNRIIGISTGVNLTQVTAHEFINFEDLQSKFEVDAFLEYKVIQIPILAKYYLDFSPQQLRFFAELGYGLSLIQSSPYSLEVAQLNGNEIFTYRRAAELSGNFLGIFGGFGLEKILPKSKALQVGLKFSSQGTTENERLQLTSGVIGFRF